MDIRELYSRIGGDFNDAMGRIPKEDLIEKFVRKYIEMDDVDKMAEAFEAADYRKVFEISHNLKGVSANLSLTSICKNITEICEAVRHGDPDRDIAGLIDLAKEQHQLLISLVYQLG